LASRILKAVEAGIAQLTHYFDSETNSDLTAAFQTIGSQLSSLRLAE